MKDCHRPQLASRLGLDTQKCILPISEIIDDHWTKDGCLMVCFSERGQNEEPRMFFPYNWLWKPRKVKRGSPPKMNEKFMAWLQ